MYELRKMKKGLSLVFLEEVVGINNNADEDKDAKNTYQSHTPEIT